MEDVLAVYTRPRDGDCPLVCLDETSKQLIAETRVPIPIKAGRPARFDYEYERNGTANLFMMFAPLEGWRHIKVTDRHTAVDYARVFRKIGVGNDPWTLRFASKFAVVYAAARLAAELKVAPWPASHPFKCVARLYRRARELVATPEEALRDLLRQLAKNASSMDRFPEVGKGDSLPKHLRKVAWGARGETRDGTLFLAIHSDRFDDLVHPRHHVSPVRSLLAEGGYTLPGKEGRHVRQIKVQGFGSAEKPYFVCVRLDRLREREP